MEVYWEYAFAENCLIDGLLLYLALIFAHGRIRARNLVLASLMGGTEAVLFPLFVFPDWCAYLVKILGGILISTLTVSKGTKKMYFVVCITFFLLTFALGGLLIAIYSFFGVEYTAEQGYLVESAPVALVLAVAALFVIFLRRAAKVWYRYRRVSKNLVSCALDTGRKKVQWRGLLDSGNCLSFRGEPVCVISAVAAFALLGNRPKAVGRIQVTTVNGSKISPVFSCEKLRISLDGTNHEYENVYLTVGEVRSKEYQIILHTALGGDP